MNYLQMLKSKQYVSIKGVSSTSFSKVIFDNKLDRSKQIKYTLYLN